MKIEVKQIVEKDVSDIRITVPVNYEEEYMPNSYPHRSGDVWSIVVDLETGQIRDWPKGVPPREICMKVRDGGSYYLLGEDGSVVGALESEYVPSCIPGEYGDYLNFKIDESGRITNWKSSCTQRNVELTFCND